MDDLTFMDATAQADLVRNGEVSPSELLEHSITRIERLNPVLNAVIYPLFEQARSAATKVDVAAPFAGVPFVLKNLLGDCADTPRSDGSGFLAGRHVSDSDCELVSRYKRAGLLIVGKSNSSEYGLLPTTEPGCHGPTRNPWNPSLGPGGSSGDRATRT